MPTISGRLPDETAEVTILRQKSHRNGIGGVPFVVSLFDVAWASGETQHMVGVSFMTERCTEGGELRRAFVDHTAVLEIGMLADGLIGMDEGAAWRGSDLYGEPLADAWQAQLPEAFVSDY